MKDFFESLWVKINRKKVMFVLTGLIVIGAAVFVFKTKTEQERQNKPELTLLEKEAERENSEKAKAAKKSLIEANKKKASGQTSDKKVSRLTNCEVSDSAYENKPFAISISNDPKDDVSERKGLTEAKVLYEARTKFEDKHTAFLALFENDTETQDFDIQKVEFLRPFLIDFAYEYNPIFVGEGALTKNANDITDLKMGLVKAGNPSRELGILLDKKGNLKMKALQERVSLEKIENKNTDDANNHRLFGDNNVKFNKTATNININYSNTANVTLEYDTSKQVYNRVQVDEEKLSFENVIVLFVERENSEGKDKADVYNYIGEKGNGKYFVNGTVTDIEWEKSSATNYVTLKSVETGNDLEIKTGKTYYGIVNTGEEKIVTIN